MADRIRQLKEEIERLKMNQSMAAQEKRGMADDVSDMWRGIHHGSVSWAEGMSDDKTPLSKDNWRLKLLNTLKEKSGIPDTEFDNAFGDYPNQGADGTIKQAVSDSLDPLKTVMGVTGSIFDASEKSNPGSATPMGGALAGALKGAPGGLVGMGVGALLGAVSSGNARSDFEKQEHKRKGALIDSLRVAPQIMEKGGSVHLNGLIVPEKMEEGGSISEDLGDILIPRQTERGEIMILPDGKIVDVMADKKHKDLPKDEITDFIPEGSYVFSHSKKKEIDLKDYKDDILTFAAGDYKESGNVPMSKITIGDIFGKKGKKTPADLVKMIRAKYPVVEEPSEAFHYSTNAENMQMRLQLIKPVMEIQEGVYEKIEIKEPEMMEDFIMEEGGVVKRRGKGDPKPKDAGIWEGCPPGKIRDFQGNCSYFTGSHKNVGIRHDGCPYGYEKSKEGDCVPKSWGRIIYSYNGDKDLIPEGYRITQAGDLVKKSRNVKGIRKCPPGYVRGEQGDCFVNRPGANQELVLKHFRAQARRLWYSKTGQRGRKLAGVDEGAYTDEEFAVKLSEVLGYDPDEKVMLIDGDLSADFDKKRFAETLEEMSPKQLYDFVEGMSAYNYEQLKKIGPGYFESSVYGGSGGWDTFKNRLENYNNQWVRSLEERSRDIKEDLNKKRGQTPEYKKAYKTAPLGSYRKGKFNTDYSERVKSLSSLGKQELDKEIREMSPEDFAKLYNEDPSGTKALVRSIGGNRASDLADIKVKEVMDGLSERDVAKLESNQSINPNFPDIKTFDEALEKLDGEDLFRFVEELTVDQLGGSVNPNSNFSMLNKGVNLKPFIDKLKKVDEDRAKKLNHALYLASSFHVGMRVNRTSEYDEIPIIELAELEDTEPQTYIQEYKEGKRSGAAAAFANEKNKHIFEEQDSTIGEEESGSPEKEVIEETDQAVDESLFIEEETEVGVDEKEAEEETAEKEAEEDLFLEEDTTEVTPNLQGPPDTEVDEDVFVEEEDTNIEENPTKPSIEETEAITEADTDEEEADKDAKEAAKKEEDARRAKAKADKAKEEKDDTFLPEEDEAPNVEENPLREEPEEPESAPEPVPEPESVPEPAPEPDSEPVPEVTPYKDLSEEEREDLSEEDKIELITAGDKDAMAAFLDGASEKVAEAIARYGTDEMRDTLINHKSPDVRFEVAANGNLAQKTILARDPDHDTRVKVLGLVNKIQDLDESEQGLPEEMKKVIAEHREHLLGIFREDPSAKIRALATSRSSLEETEKMLNDDDERVVKAARDRIEKVKTNTASSADLKEAKRMLSDENDAVVKRAEQRIEELVGKERAADIIETGRGLREADLAIAAGMEANKEAARVLGEFGVEAREVVLPVDPLPKIEQEPLEPSGIEPKKKEGEKQIEEQDPENKYYEGLLDLMDTVDARMKKNYSEAIDNANKTYRQGRLSNMATFLSGFTAAGTQDLSETAPVMNTSLISAAHPLIQESEIQGQLTGVNKSNARALESINASGISGSRVGAALSGINARTLDAESQIRSKALQFNKGQLGKQYDELRNALNINEQSKVQAENKERTSRNTMVSDLGKTTASLFQNNTLLKMNRDQRIDTLNKALDESSDKSVQNRLNLILRMEKNAQSSDEIDDVLGRVKKRAEEIKNNKN